MLSNSEVTGKVKEYESFLEDVLKRDLLEVQKGLRDKVDKHKEWEEVKHVVKTLKEFRDKDEDMSLRVGLGFGVHVAGEVTNYERLYIRIGLGCVLEMDCEEADKYSDIRMKSLKRDIDHYRKLAVDVKVHIKMVLLAINELQSAMLSNYMDKAL